MRVRCLQRGEVWGSGLVPLLQLSGANTLKRSGADEGERITGTACLGI